MLSSVVFLCVRPAPDGWSNRRNRDAPDRALRLTWEILPFGETLLFLAVIGERERRIANICADRSDIVSAVARYSEQQLAVTLELKADEYFYGSGILETITFVS